MTIALEQLRLRSADWVTSTHRSFRPPSWPPPPDWIAFESRDGAILSRWNDSIWDLSALAGYPLQLNFGDGPDPGRSVPLDPGNANLLRLMTGWRLWGPRAVLAAATVQGVFSKLRSIFELCSGEGILASDLMRFPKILEKVPAILAPSGYEAAIAELHRFWDLRDTLGFVLVDQEGIKRLAAWQPSHDTEQTAYIPPRIWTYQVNRMRECIDDFLVHRQQVEDCFNFCVDAYANNAGSLQAAVTTALVTHHQPFSPFCISRRTRSGRHVQAYGQFHEAAERFGITDLLNRWVVSKKQIGISQLSAYLTLVQYAGLAYIASFTLQRVNEAAALRTDCLLWENDPKLGSVPIICGETTKTDPDSDARWPTSPSVEVGVAVMTSIARMRIRCAAAHPEIHPTEADQANPYLLDRAFEPWCGGKTQPFTTRRYPMPFSALLRVYPLLFDQAQIKITEDDLKIALMLTPNLSAKKGFVVGKVWPFAWHQLRRTGAVNMFASGLFSDSSMQFLLKHSSRLMPLYYGRGYTKLHVNEEVENVVIAAMYDTMAQSILSAMSDRFVSPHSVDAKNEIIVNMIGEKDAKDLAKSARRGEVFFRETRLGVCTTRGNCSYGGIESIARCSGGDGHKPCKDAIFDRSKKPSVEIQIKQLNHELAGLRQDSPRHQALLAERNGLENYISVVQS